MKASLTVVARETMEIKGKYKDTTSWGKPTIDMEYAGKNILFSPTNRQ